MRKIIFSMNVTLDGFYEGPNHELDWTIADAELHDFYANLLDGADLILFGRVIYKMMEDFWPTAPSDPKASQSEKRFANALNPKSKIVFSKTLKQVGWNTQLRHSIDPQEIRDLKEQAGNYILLDGGTALVQEFIKNGLVDEYMPVIHPVAIGKGKALFGGFEHFPELKHQKSQRLNSGAVALSYKII